MKSNENYYVLFCQTLKVNRLCKNLNLKDNVYAFIPRMETYLHVKDLIVLKDMFPGYIFVQSTMNQSDFNTLIYSLKEERDGLIKELKKKEVSALSKDEISLFDQLLDVNGILKMSYGHKEQGKTIVTSGPLVYFKDSIIDTNKRDMTATLNIVFMNRNIKAGIMIGKTD